MPVTYTLESGVEINRESPTKFYLPPLADRESLRPGDLVKLIFRISDGEEVNVERMWVIVQEVRAETYLGVLDNDPYCTEEIRSGMPVEFHSDHVIQIQRGAN